MISFFRKIRKKLTYNNKPSKYLHHDFGNIDTISIKGGFKRYNVLFFLLITQSYVDGKQNNTMQVEKLPIEVDITLQINRIYNINSVDETYKVDGCFFYKWRSEQAKLRIVDSLSTHVIFENERAKEFLKSVSWIPAFDLINVQGNRDIPNIQIKIDSTGEIVYKESFSDTFSTNMDFNKFPFDSKIFKVEIESFGLESRQLVFVNPKLFLDKHVLDEDWIVVRENAVVKLNNYPFSGQEKYSRVAFVVEANRNPKNYISLVLFPLLILILSSFSIFWLKDFKTQIIIGLISLLSSLVLNIFSASFIPKLPYRTFIEYIMSISHLFIFAVVFTVIITKRKKELEGPSSLIRHLRYFFPLAYLASILLLFKWKF
ncbi:hypothetical protein [Maribacter aestuarii]|uniref:hypothetical protein n=1 Tax=Maribacter aestuarii TaxID=1130723 RepID=UPI00248BB79D|nr:hypothetical protein [Maribacter aestuarii]